MEQHENLEAAAWRLAMGKQRLALPLPLAQDEMAKLPKPAAERFWRIYHGSNTRLALSEVGSTARALEFLRAQHIPMAAEAVVAAGHGWLHAKYRPGKTTKSLHVGVACRLGKDHRECTADKTVSWFYAPANLALLDGPGFCFLPAWFVAKALQGVRERSRSARLKVDRIPVDAPCWPPALADGEYFTRLLKWLPTSAELDACRLAIIESRRVAEQKVMQWEADSETRAALATRQAEARNKREQKSAVARQKRIAQQPSKTNVNVRWRTWSKLNGRFVAADHEASGVTVRLAGARAYIVFSTGREIAVATKNLTVE
ncbi:MAG: hypothetical protein BGO63_18315 [Candidatus Accumulibacter sp. 66-26]|nr:hypothetical protein [Accumulibacter sp.]OJW51852.1 MAG: hypothetical protein BGO63_18315 [Candidatus Accumulibacter sp. 66-26]